MRVTLCPQVAIKSALIAETPMDKGFEAMYEGMRAKCNQLFIYWLPHNFTRL